jgi:uncharacterized protein (DUF1697 family)
MRYVALLRGINVGGNKKVPMADLKKALVKAGYGNVKTLLASGNVLLDATEKTAAALRKNLETLLKETFGFGIPTIVRTAEQLRKLAATDPFKGVTVDGDTRLYVTFLGESNPKGTIAIPYVSPEKTFRILAASKTEVISVLRLDGNARTVDAMAVLEKEYGRDVTTRNWNTVVKLIA